MIIFRIQFNFYLGIAAVYRQYFDSKIKLWSIPKPQLFATPSSSVYYHYGKLAIRKRLLSGKELFDRRFTVTTSYSWSRIIMNTKFLQEYDVVTLNYKHRMIPFLIKEPFPYRNSINTNSPQKNHNYATNRLCSEPDIALWYWWGSLHWWKFLKWELEELHFKNAFGWNYPTKNVIYFQYLMLAQYNIKLSVPLKYYLPELKVGPDHHV